MVVVLEEQLAERSAVLHGPEAGRKYRAVLEGLERGLARRHRRRAMEPIST
ncbi:MAG: hypothetical protein ACSLFB_05405 [Acidimicrobiales bacterium]